MSSASLVILASHSSGWLAINKPTGVLSHPNANGRGSALLPFPYDAKEEYYHAEDGNYYLIHRLDGPTSGVLLIATNQTLAEALRQCFEGRNVEKVYYAWVKGFFQKKTGTWKHLLKKERGANSVKMQVGGSLTAETRYKCVDATRTPLGTFSLLELTPLTGRTHQLRIQCAENHTPILGDESYGDFALNKRLKQSGLRRLLLHAYSLKIPQYAIDVQAPLGADFKRWA